MIMEKEVFDRMLIEFKENSERTNNLRDFILNQEKFNTLDNLNKDLLIAQLKSMESYISILSIRIGLNSKVMSESEINAEEVSESENNG